MSCTLPPDSAFAGGKEPRRNEKDEEERLATDGQHWAAFLVHFAMCMCPQRRVVAVSGLRGPFVDAATAHSVSSVHLKKENVSLQGQVLTALSKRSKFLKSGFLLL